MQVPCPDTWGGLVAGRESRCKTVQNVMRLNRMQMNDHPNWQLCVSGTEASGRGENFDKLILTEKQWH